VDSQNFLNLWFFSGGNDKTAHTTFFPEPILRSWVTTPAL
jgi:hypothetical protein